jgi:hypothetical protein
VYLDESVPSGGDDDRVGGIGRESYTADPFAMSFFCDGELAVAEGVPELDCLISATTDYLSVVGREGDGEDVVGVADEATGGFASVEIPETEGLVPGCGKSVLTVRRDDNVLHEVVVSLPLVPCTDRQYLESPLCVSVGAFLPGESPDNDGLVARGGNDHVGILRRGSQGSDPTIVTWQLTFLLHKRTHTLKSSS